MSGKFMKVKKIIIPTLTMIIIASQLMGCAAATQSELIDMLDKGEAIEIEIAVPANQEQGTEQFLEWTQLDQLTSQPELRKAMDDIYKISKFGENSKNGIFYINLEGKQEGNNTLYNAFANSVFRSDFWENETIREATAEAAANSYADVEYEEGNYDKAVLAAINGYYNILNDSEVGFANMDSTLTRLEAMAAIFKAENPVTDSLSEDMEFNSAVDPSNSNKNTIYASNLSEQSYLDISSGSLDELTAKGTITRGELVYLIVQQYFPNEYKNADTQSKCYSDAVNAGNIAAEQKVIENATSKQHWQAYELSYAINNPDKGCPERMYKALVVAYDKGIITDNDCRWDEGATKAELLEMLTNAYLALPVQITASQGTGEAIQEIPEEKTQEEIISSGGSMTGGSIELDEWEKEALKEAEEAEAEMPEATTSTIEIVEELDKTMYGIKNGNIRNGDSTDYDIVASLEYGATIHVTGKTANGWYRIQWGDTEAYCASSLLADSMPSDSGNTSEIPQQPTQPEQPTQPSTPPSSGGGNNNGGSVPGTNLPQPSQDWGNLW